MKTVEELKQEQYDLKAKLHEVVELINSKEYFDIPAAERGLINQQRVGMELYLSCLTKRVYGEPNSQDTSNFIWLSMLWGMFNTPSGFGADSKDYLNDILDKANIETKEESDE
jgi:hypothetical protein